MPQTHPQSQPLFASVHLSSKKSAALVQMFMLGIIADHIYLHLDTSGTIRSIHCRLLLLLFPLIARF